MIPTATACLVGCGAPTQTQSVVPRTAQEALAQCSAPEVAERVKDVVIPSAFGFKQEAERHRLQKVIAFAVSNVSLNNFSEDTGETECKAQIDMMAAGLRETTLTEYTLTPSGRSQPMTLSIPDDADLQRKLAILAQKV